MLFIFFIVVIALLLVILFQTTNLWLGARHTTSGSKNQPVFIDTSVLMDGRITAIAETGFFPKNVVIPRSVVGEMQLLADKSDSEKRERARRGLDVVRALQALDTIHVTIMQDGSRADEGVDERLLQLTKQHGGSLCTIDYNLNKVAQVEGITVLNVNDLAKNIRMTYLPGDIISLSLTDTGSDSHQAVGHLEDGTMVVVEHARQAIKKTVEVEIIRSLQTAAGRMMFAKLSGADALKHSETGKAKKSPKLQTKNSSRSTPKMTARPQKTIKAAQQDDTAAKKPATNLSRGDSKNQAGRKQQATSTRNTRRKPTSRDREASLVDLIDNQ